LSILLLSTASAFGQQSGPAPDALPSAPQPAASAAPCSSSDPKQCTPAVPPFNKDTKRRNEIAPSGNIIPPSHQQPKRILGVMPNYRAVSAGAAAPPPTLKESFVLASQNSFDYSSFVFTALTSMIAEGEDVHPQLGKGIPGFWAYSWRGFIDKTDGNYLVLFALPTVLHEDERYYAMGTGNPWKRLEYSATRVFITPDYSGHNTFNAAELIGRAAAQGVSTTYYPAADRTASAIASKWGYAVMRDALTNSFREFWPDIAVHVLHRHP
jgi:hypothetical protein